MDWHILKVTDNWAGTKDLFVPGHHFKLAFPLQATDNRGNPKLLL